jgi:molybdopterin-containing oxidoreductase family membrane subunit
MKYFVREEHFDALGKLMLIFSFTWAYFYFNEYMVEWYGGDLAAKTVLKAFTQSPYGWIWYLMLFCNIAVPWLLLWNKRVRRTPWLMFVIGFLINVGMYAERFIIVPTEISTNRFPFMWGDYVPRIELVISIGSLSLFLLLYAVASRLIPLIPVWEVQEGQLAHSLKRFGKQEVATKSEIE